MPSYGADSRVRLVNGPLPHRRHNPPSTQLRTKSVKRYCDVGRFPLFAGGALDCLRLRTRNRRALLMHMAKGVWVKGSGGSNRSSCV
jgi:hypothetical protein